MADINYPQRWLKEHNAQTCYVGWYREKTFEVLKCQKDLDTSHIEVTDVFITVPDEVDCQDTIHLNLKFLPRVANKLEFHLTISDPTICKYNDQTNELEFLNKTGEVTLSVTMLDGGATAEKTIKSIKNASGVRFTEGNTFIKNIKRKSTVQLIPSDSSEKIVNVSIWDNNNVLIEKLSENTYNITCSNVGSYELKVETDRKKYKLPIKSIESDKMIVDSVTMDVKPFYGYKETIHIQPTFLPETATLKDYNVIVENTDIANYVVGKNAIVTNEINGTTKATIKMLNGTAKFDFDLKVKDGNSVTDLEDIEVIGLPDVILFNTDYNFTLKAIPETENIEDVVLTSSLNDTSIIKNQDETYTLNAQSAGDLIITISSNKNEFEKKVNVKIVTEFIERFELDFGDKVDTSIIIPVNVKVFPNPFSTDYIVTVEGDLELENNILISKTNNNGSGTIVVTATDGSGVVLRHPLIIEKMENKLFDLRLDMSEFVSNDSNEYSLETVLTYNEDLISPLQKLLVYKTEGNINLNESNDSVYSDQFGYGVVYVVDMYTGLESKFNIKIFDENSKLTTLSISKMRSKIHISDRLRLTLNTVPEFAKPESFGVYYDNNYFHHDESMFVFKPLKITEPEENTTYVSINASYTLNEGEENEESINKNHDYGIKIVDYQILTPSKIDFFPFNHLYNHGSNDIIYVNFYDDKGNKLNANSLVDNSIMVYGVTGNPQHEIFNYQIECKRNRETGIIELDNQGREMFEIRYNESSYGSNISYVGEEYNMSIIHPSSAISTSKKYIVEDGSKSIEKLDFTIRNDATFYQLDGNMLGVGVKYLVSFESSPAYVDLNEVVPELINATHVIENNKLYIIPTAVGVVKLKFTAFGFTSKEKLYDGIDYIAIGSVNYPNIDRDAFVGDILDVTPTATPSNATFGKEYEVGDYNSFYYELIDKNTLKVIKPFGSGNMSYGIYHKFNGYTSRRDFTLHGKPTDIRILDLEDNYLSLGNSDYLTIIPTVEGRFDSLGLTTSSTENVNVGTNMARINSLELGAYEIKVYSDKGQNPLLVRTYTGEVIAENITKSIRYNIEDKIPESIRVDGFISAKFHAFPYNNNVKINITINNGNLKLIDDKLYGVSVGDSIITVTTSMDNNQDYIPVTKDYNIKVEDKFIDVPDDTFISFDDKVYSHRSYVYEIVSSNKNIKDEDIILEGVKNCSFRYTNPEYKLIQIASGDTFEYNIREAKTNRIIGNYWNNISTKVYQITFYSNFLSTGIDKELPYYIEGSVDDFKFIDIYEETGKMTFNDTLYDKGIATYTLPSDYKGQGVVLFIKTSLDDDTYYKHIFTAI